MALEEEDKANFETLRIAALEGELALVQSLRLRDREEVALVCRVYRDADGEYIVVPLAEMVSGNPVDLYMDPTAGGGPKSWTPGKKKRRGAGL